MDAKTLKERIGEAQRDGGRMPAPLQAAIVQYVVKQQSAGMSMKALATELGLSSHTLSYWKARRPRPEATLARVKVVQAELEERTVVVHVPSGLRIEGLSVPQMAELIARLR